MSETFDLIVVGAGPGGYVAAIRAAQLGMRVACVEGRETLGGTCLNIGCIPSKALLQSSEEFVHAGHGLAAHGVLVEKVGLDLARMQARKDSVVEANVKGVEYLFRKNKVTWLKGWGRIAAPGQVVVNGTSYAARHIVIASGSESTPLPGVAVDEKRIVTSTGGLALESVPKRLVVIGGGYIGLELGSVWQRLGAEVTVVEFLDRLVPAMDGELAKQLERVLARQGMKFRLGTRVIAAEPGNEGVRLRLEPVKGGEASELLADVVLVSIGRRPFTNGLGIAELGIALDKGGQIVTGRGFATSVSGIHAIGDAIAGPMLAHKAMDEGAAVAEIIAGQAAHVNYDAIPGVVYTWPEAAAVSKTEEELKAAGIAYKIGKYPFTANPRARAMGETDGFVKILADAKTDAVLGAHILGPDAGTLIAELVMVMELGASAEDIAMTSHAHPTLNEAIKEAALAADGRAIHL
ncbi:MAG TPA: dihydrolipoyl dehydrogenase [Acetobacteraceae bacterium]|nr:dihydrolipoyl dehydrogenase [Acetobacteraceae bacterium]